MANANACDVIVIGAGPAGLSAALQLGRCNRATLVIDAGDPRNAMVHASHGFFTRDGEAPATLRYLGRAQAERYGVRFTLGTASRAWASRPRGFAVQCADGRVFQARALVLATGVREILPDVPGMTELYGRGVFPCPMCEGFEYTGRALGAFGADAWAVQTAVNLRTWSQQVALYANGATLSRDHAARLRRAGVDVCAERVVELWRDRATPQLVAVATEHNPWPCDALFVPTRFEQASDIPRQLGCVVTAGGTLATTADGAQTSVQYVYAAGDADGGIPWISQAAASGARAGMMAHAGLLELDYP